MKNYELIKRLGLQIYSHEGALDKSKWIVDIDELEELLKKCYKNNKVILLVQDPIITECNCTCHARSSSCT